MKKLSLKNLNFEAKDLLSRNQLKRVNGGYKDGDLDGFFCGKYIWDICDFENPESYEGFNSCMESWGCH